MDLTLQVPMQYCSLLPLPAASTTGTVFTLAPSLHSFWSYFSTLLQQHIGHLLTWGVHLSVSYIFAFYTVHGVLNARIIKWVAIPCLTTSNLPWFKDLTFQVPMQYCCLQHWTLLLSPVISTTGCCFCFGSISSFFLELSLHSSPVAYCVPTNLGSSSFSVIPFCLFAFLT